MVGVKQSTWFKLPIVDSRDEAVVVLVSRRFCSSFDHAVNLWTGKLIDGVRVLYIHPRNVSPPLDFFAISLEATAASSLERVSEKEEGWKKMCQSGYHAGEVGSDCYFIVDVTINFTFVFCWYFNDGLLTCVKGRSTGRGFGFSTRCYL